MKKNLKVFQSNKFVESKQEYSVNEKRLLSILIAHIKDSDEEFITYSISIEELSEASNRTKENFYAVADTVTDGLMSKIIKIDSDNKKGFKKFPIVSMAEYDEGLLTLRISEKMNNIFLNLQQSKEYTAYQLTEFLALTSTHAQRIYELVKQYEHSKQKERTISIEDLKMMLGIEGKYKIFSKFKISVLDIALKQIEEKTNLRYKWKGIKKGRKIESIRFFEIAIAGKTSPTKKDIKGYGEDLIGEFFYSPQLDKNVKIVSIKEEKNKILVFDTQNIKHSFKDLQQVNSAIMKLRMHRFMVQDIKT